jgi:hypothetical protein
VKIAREEENVIPYVAFTLITVQERLVRKRKEKGDKRFYSDNIKRQEQCTCPRRKWHCKAS